MTLHLWKALTCCLTVTGFVNPPIGQALALNGLEGLCGTGCIVNFESGTIAIAEIELRQIAMQMRL